MGISRGGELPSSETHFKREGGGQRKIRDKSDRRDIAVSLIRYQPVYSAWIITEPIWSNVTTCYTRDPFGAPRAELFSLSPTTDAMLCIVHLRHKELNAPVPLVGSPSKTQNQKSQNSLPCG